jgi:hypothetical protein
MWANSKKNIWMNAQNKTINIDETTHFSTKTIVCTVLEAITSIWS